MKKLTLDETWKQCLAMWKWISRQCFGKSWQWCKANVIRLKREWLEANGFRDATILNDCFFCSYTKHINLSWQDCFKCPAKLVDYAFRTCHKKEHHYQIYPRKFYAKLKQLNKIRLES